ncbi:histidine acid phosphatase [Fistulina hepatica ATCC 64428]|uniref:Histidine acid phosphatase n=1 Tax=Fistulina hepatica ATCC 64428 TaxID=1128425 RepID=A0A0D6ZZC8_9AGAR|nr:histidine acid phosphatase [Fistulina hepatica ATCC 64428]
MLSLTIGLVVLIASVALGLTPIETFYPPDLNDTSYIPNATIGLYGGVYQSPTREPNTSAPYGTYDYCFMPHPRTQEYTIPAAIGNGSLTGSLVFVEYLQRHQRRTPYNILPNGESEPYYCDDIYPYLYAGPQNGIAPLPVYAETYTSPNNPFVSTYYVPGSCQFPQLTIGGLLDGYQHGRDLWAVYGEKLGLLPSTPDDTIYLRSSTSPLTQGSAGGVLRGIWPNYAGALPLHQQASSVDTIDEGYTCAARSTVLSELESTDLWNQHLDVAAPLVDNLVTKLGADSSAWTETFDHFSDNFQGRLCNGYVLPCSVSNSSDCVTADQAAEVFRAGDWEWNYYWRTNPYATLYIQLVEGLFIGEVLARFEAVANGTSDLKFSHTFAHDGDVGPVLGALGINELRWPGMGSNIAFEIWETSDSQNPLYARVLYCGQPIETIYGVLDWLPLSSLIAILRPFVPEDIVAMCNA